MTMVISKDMKKLALGVGLLTFIVLAGMLYNNMQLSKPSSVEGFKENNYEIDFPENEIIAVQRANLLSVPGSGLSTGGYFNVYKKDKVIHKTMAGLPNVRGGFSVDGEVQYSVYKVWLVKKDTGDAMPLGILERDSDGVSRLEVETDNKGLFNQFDMVAITFERDPSSTRPGKIVLKGGLRSTNGVIC